MTISKNTPWQWIVFPILSVLFVVLYSAFDIGKWPLSSPAAIVADVVMIVIMFGTVFAAVYHAELIAARVGEPFGTLVLSLAVTVIEVALITSLMLMPEANATLARDTRALYEGGYELADLGGIDLFPNTAHVESIAVLTR